MIVRGLLRHFRHRDLDRRLPGVDACELVVGVRHDLLRARLEELQLERRLVGRDVERRDLAGGVVRAREACVDALDPHDRAAWVTPDERIR